MRICLPRRPLFWHWGIDVLDHVILTPTDWFSMAEHGRVPQYNPGTGQLLFAARATWPMEPEKPKQIKR